MKLFDATQQPLLGVHLIEASAGTGKTYSITLLLLRLIVERGMPIDSVLLVTFTEAATLELREKVYQRIQDAFEFLESRGAHTAPDDAALYETMMARVDGDVARRRLAAALHAYDRAQIFTIHGFCQRMLTEHALETGMEFGLELNTSDEEFFDTLVRDFWLAYCADKSPLLIDLFYRNQVGVDRLKTLARTVHSKPDLVVRTQRSSRNAEQRYGAAYRRARQRFLECERRLEGAFLLAKGINRRRYRKDLVPKWLEEVRTLFSAPEPLTLFKKDHSLERFSYGRIIESAAGDEVEIDEVAFFRAVDGLLEARDELMGEIETLYRIFVSYVVRILPERKAAGGALFYDDLLLRLKAALDGESRQRLQGAIAKRYQAALIDEFQDTDAIQYHIFRELFVAPKIPFFMIGDPKQAIYAFRGGDIFAYMSAAAAARENTWNLETNWRSSADLVQAVNHLFSSVENPFLFNEIAFHPVKPYPGSESVFQHRGTEIPGFQFLFCRRTPDNCRQSRDGKWGLIPASHHVHVHRTCEDIKALLDGTYTIGKKAVLPGDIAVLTRRNDQSILMRDALLQHGILAVVSRRESVFETVAAREMFEIFSAIADAQPSRIRTALSTIAFGFRGQQLFQLIADTARLDRWQGVFADFRTLYETRGMVALTGALETVESISGDGGMKARILKGGNRRYLSDVMQLLDIFRQHFFARRVPFEEVMAQLETWLQQLPGDDEFERRQENTENAVQIVTIHKSKGLQYPVVYLPFLLMDGAGSEPDVLVYHDTRADNVEVCDLKVNRDEEATSQKEREDRAESIRLLYVALTRAQHVCRIVFGAFKGLASSPLATLLPGMDGMEEGEMADAALLQKLADFCGRTGAAVMTDDTVPPSAIEAGGQASGGSAATDDADNGALHGLLTVDASFEPLRFHHFTWTADQGARGESFSSLTAGAPTPATTDEGGRPEEDWPHPVQHGADMAADAASDDDHNELNNGFIGLNAAFEKGPRFGSMIHDLLEECIGKDLRPSALSRKINSLLAGYGFGGGMDATRLGEWVTDLLRTPLTDDGQLCLGRLDGVRVAELEFVMPVEPGASLSPTALAAAMMTDADLRMRNYEAHLRELQFSTFHGFLKGFIDLVFEFDGKYFIADYKTNDLGEDAAGYGPDALNLDMARHHYYLQYHLYTLALHRYLGRHKADYQYERDFGGVYYLYVRGMSSGQKNRYGVFYDCPPASRIDALDRMMRRMEGASP